MIKKIPLALCALLSLTPASYAGFTRLVFNDDFENTTTTYQKWKIENNLVRNVKSDLWSCAYVSSLVQFHPASSLVRIRSSSADVTINGKTYETTCGWMHTYQLFGPNHSFHVRMKATSPANGTSFAAWCFKVGDYDEEIDIVETAPGHFGGASFTFNKVSQGGHWDDPSQSDGRGGAGGSVSVDTKVWNTYCVEYRKDRLDFYVNGVYRRQAFAPANQLSGTMNIILNASATVKNTSLSWLGQASATTTWTTAHDIDWVKVYAPAL
jgi:hypothetical protein